MRLLICLFLMFNQTVWAQSSRPIGTPGNGTLTNAEKLPLKGEGYMQVFKDSKHHWGTEEIIWMIQHAARDMKSKFRIQHDQLQFEDISAQHGGDIDPHGSHENGLDVDLQYYKLNEVEHDPVATGQMYAPEMVVDGHPSPNFDTERNWELMKALHRHGRVQKIFTDRILKKELCRWARKVGDFKTNIHVLRSLRHESNHQDHMHVRLRCPKYASDCVPLANPPEGSGCPAYKP